MDAELNNIDSLTVETLAAICNQSTEPPTEKIVDDMKQETNEDDKPRIILTLRTSETDPDAYFSTSRLEHDDESNCSTDDKEPVEKRRLRKITNANESVLQNAIARKEKSFDMPETYRRRAPPKPKTPKNTDVMVADKVEEWRSGERCEGEETAYEHRFAAMATLYRSNGSGATSVTKRRRKRYYKGLSYSFSNKRYVKRRRLGTRQHKPLPSESSELDTDSQNAAEVGEPADLETGSSQSESLSIKSGENSNNCSRQNSMDIMSEKYDDVLSPSTGDTAENAARPESTLISAGGGTAGLCLCQVQEKLFMKIKPGTQFYCQAVDTVEDKNIGCCNFVDIIDEEDIKLQRPSVRVAYASFCKVHSHRVSVHNCCPTCGKFCTQGDFAMCESRHIYHRNCELTIEERRLCPHCGEPSPPDNIHISIGQNQNPVFLPLQKFYREVPTARMSIFGSVTVNKHEDRVPTPPLIPALSLTLPSGKQIFAEGLPTIEKEKLENYLLELLQHGSSNCSPAQRYNYRSLYLAAKAGDIEKICACLNAGLNANHLFREYMMGTALHAACTYGHLAAIHVLIQAGTQLDTLDKEQNTALMMAAQNGHNDVVKYLVKAGACVSFKGMDGMTALHLAAKSGNVEACYYLLSNPNTPRNFVNSVDEGGWTALVWAAEHNHLEVALYLLSKGADPLVRDSEQNIALHWAAYAGSVDISEALLQYNSDINCTNVHGDTPLHISARHDLYNCVVLLLARGARTDLKNKAEKLAVDSCLMMPCDSHKAIQLSMRLKEITSASTERTTKILTNDITKGYEFNPIQCINEVDDDEEPKNFVYITENCFTSNIKVDRSITSLKSCTCEDNCTTGSCLCSKLSLQWWYTDEGKLIENFNYNDPPMLFECNALCKCNKIICQNRVVQNGTTERFQLFRTQCKGWGVSTLKLIPKGTYVCEYVGEIISDTEADTRHDDSYLFDLENKDGETFCIDACRYGNIARFINHSCAPNLQPVRVFVGHQDLRFPRIAFFAKRDIQPYEEFGFDYGEKFWIIKYKSFTCTCNAETCRYSEKTIQSTLDAYNKKIQSDEQLH